MKRILLALALIFAPASAWAQCSGVFADQTVCGNATGSSNTPRATAITGFTGLFANPTASVGLSTVNGSATTAMRSDAAPPLSQAIIPTWTGLHTFTAGYNQTGPGSGTISFRTQAAAGTYNFNWPITAGTSGQPLLSGGGGATAMFYGTLSGNTTAFGTTSGSLVSANCLKGDASGNIAANTACGASGFATLQPFSSQATGSTDPWNATDPFGNAISCAGTNSQCLQEFITAAAAGGWSWRVIGNGTISSTVAISVPKCFLRSESIATGVTISWSALGATNLFVLDSHENCDVSFLGAFNQNSADTGAVVVLAPTTSGPGGVIVAASQIEISSVAPGTAGTGIKFDLASGGVVGNAITIHDVNGGATGILVTNPGSALIAFEQNKFFLTYNHGQTTRSVQIGTSATNQSNMRYNTWFPGKVSPGTGATVGWDTWASNDTYIGIGIDNETASATTGLLLESGANSNSFYGGVVQGTTPLTDNGTGNVFINTSGTINTYSRQMIPISAGGTTQAQNTTQYNLTVGSAGEGFVQGTCPYAGRFKFLYLNTTAPAAGQTIVATFRVNNADTALTCTITGAGTSCNDQTHTASCSAGQTYSLKTVTSATSGTINSISGGVEYDAP